ncbi:protein Mdm4 [Hemiscyllium ocellatum]|uniref:protein Mdm4 n=1 Tax=Hemiscyllium ocellatum TaxID=170820 RepID=UPI0029675DA9|nr:protein Mdm4 [Hemiscyllium ocellatum]
MTTASTSKPYTSESPCSVSAEKLGQIRPKTPLLNILHEAGASGEHFTLKEIMHYLGQYIMLKQLYDQQQQHIVHCGNDALGKVFGVQSFSVKDPSHLYGMLSRNLRTANFQDAAQTGTLVKDTKCLPMREDRLKCPALGELSEEEITAWNLPTSATSHLKRKNSESDESVTDDQSECQAKDSISGLWDAAALPWWFITSLRSNYGSRKSGSTDICSNQDIDTAIVSDSTDDLWFLNEPASDEVNVEIKFETVETKEKDPRENQKGEEEKNTECKEAYSSLQVTIYEADDDLPCSGDATDTEISDVFENSDGLKDSWKCTNCGKCNPSQKQYCLQCWALRKGWYLNPKFVHSTSDPLITGFEATEEAEGIDVPDCRKSVSEPLIQTEQLQCNEKGKHIQHGSSESLDRLSQPSTSSINFSNKEELRSEGGGSKTQCEDSSHFRRNCLGPCLVCGVRPRTGNIIHGKTGHLVACYACAKMLHKRKLPCPVCVQPINTVIRTFIG